MLRAARAAAERPDRDDFFAFMFLARCKHEMGEDDEVLLRRAEVAWAKHG